MACGKVLAASLFLALAVCAADSARAGRSLLSRQEAQPAVQAFQGHSSTSQDQVHQRGHHNHHTDRDLVRGTLTTTHQHRHQRDHSKQHHAWTRKMLSTLGVTTAASADMADAASSALIWPPRDPVTPGCAGAYCGGGGWSNYGYTQAVPAGGNPYLTPDGYMRPMPLVGGRH